MRGYFNHLAVKKEFWKKGIARELIDICLEQLKEEGIGKYRVVVPDENKRALEFWKHIGFSEQVYDCRTFQMNMTSG